MRSQPLGPLLLALFAAHFAYPSSLAFASPRERRAVVFYTAQTQGTLEPCGCTSDPLGDIARVTALVRGSARAGATLLVDAGNLTYPAGEIPSRRQEAADLVASFLAREITRLPFGGSALGETDLACGVAKVQPKRLAANLDNLAFVEPSRISPVGGIKIGVFGLVDPALVREKGLRAEEPVSAAHAEADRLRASGAEIVIALAPLERQQARAVAREASVDFVVLGNDVGEGSSRAEKVGRAFLLVPGSEMQRVGRLQIVLRHDDGRPSGEPLRDAGGPAASRMRSEEVGRQLRQLDAELARWEEDASSDPAFVAAKREERAELRAEAARLASTPWSAPAKGSYFINELVPIRRSLARDPALAASMRRLDQAVGAANLRVAEPPPPAEPGQAHFLGDASCVRCHKAAVRFCKRTAHAHAWRTLQAVGKTGHGDCVSCHVTGYGEMGGSSLGFSKGLENIQCEACHGPGSIHVEKRGLEKPLALRTRTPESVCTRCHNEKHSDTFQYEAYLRDIIGPGHGEDVRDDLGAGPTARDLRRAAAKRASISAKQPKELW
ncbi:MAG: multiheme c-type cytochrome [Polyangia bacterium]